MPGHHDVAPAPKLGSFRWLGLPSWLLLLLMALPLVGGGKTLIYRDVLNTHYPLKVAQSQLADEGWPGPLLDPFRGGGQPLLGNPNAVPFYPTNLLYRVADPLWALNAHLWLHWLLAPFAAYWLGRSWRLSRAGAWACGIAWTTSGFVMSLMNLYNMVALAALAPATVAAYVSLARSARPWPGARLAAAAALTGLTFLGGDPASAALVYLLAAAAYLAVVAEFQTPSATLRPGTALARPALAAGLGLLLAAPVLVEMLRVLPTSYRGLWQYETSSVLAQSWHPMMLLDWLVPGFFGRLDLSFWGGAVFGGNPPFFSSLFPGWIVVALAAAAGLRRRRQFWAWGAVGVGAFLALGGHNPLLARLAEWTDFGLLRYPVKAWLAVAIGLSLLAGLGFERVWRRGPSRRVFLLVLFGAFLWIFWTRLHLDADSALARLAVDLSGGRLTGAGLDAEVERWGLVMGWQFLLFAPLVGLVALPKRPNWTPAFLLILHTITQISLLVGLLAIDAVPPYRAPSPLAAQLQAESSESPVDLVHGAFDQQFGPPSGSSPATDPSIQTLSRSLFGELFHGAGVAQGLRYPFTRSPEGLDSFYAVAFAKALPRLDDAGRLRLLEAAGVEYLLLDRPLAPRAAPRVEQPARVQTAQNEPVWIYRLRFVADEVALVGAVRRADSMSAARDLLLDPSFDPSREVILPGDATAAAAADATAVVPADDGVERSLGVIRNQPELLEIETASDAVSHLVLQRAWLPTWRATVDGEPAEIEIANGWQMAVEIPAGRREVTIFVDRRPSRWALVAFFVALGIVAWLLFAAPRASAQEAARESTQARGV